MLKQDHSFTSLDTMVSPATYVAAIGITFLALGILFLCCVAYACCAVKDKSERHSNLWFITCLGIVSTGLGIGALVFLAMYE